MPRGRPGQAPRPGKKGRSALYRAIFPIFIGETAHLTPAFRRREKNEAGAWMCEAQPPDASFGKGSTSPSEPDRYDRLALRGHLPALFPAIRRA